MTDDLQAAVVACFDKLETEMRNRRAIVPILIATLLISLAGQSSEAGDNESVHQEVP